MVMKERSRTEMQVASCGACSAEELHALGTGRIYIRPIQTYIVLDESLAFGQTETKEECFICHGNVPLNDLRKHMESCGVEVSIGNHTNLLGGQH